MRIKLKADTKLEECWRGGVFKTVLYEKGTIFNVDDNGTYYNCDIRNGPSITIMYEDCVVVDY